MYLFHMLKNHCPRSFRICKHEAAHALVAVGAHLELQSVEVERDAHEVVSGVTWISRARAQQLDVDLMCFSIAGIAASFDTLPQADSDLVSARRELSAITRTYKAADADLCELFKDPVFNKCYYATKHFLRHEDRALERLAYELWGADRLTGAEAERIIFEEKEKTSEPYLTWRFYRPTMQELRLPAGGDAQARLRALSRTITVSYR